MYPVLMTINGYRLRQAIDDAIDHGYGVQHGVLYPETAGVLTTRAQQLTFSPCREVGVYQHFDQVGFNRQAFPDELNWLASGVESIVRERARSRARHGLATWSVNDISVQKYADHAAGIGYHRDYASDKHIVVVFTLCGAARIGVIDNASQEQKLLMSARSVLCLAAPDPISGNDPRLVHAVGPPIGDGPRISIALRMNVVSSTG